jgi:hypothetical protein
MALRREDLMQHLPRAEDLPPGFELPRPISVTFIPACVFDNPALLQVNPEYVSWLRSLPRSSTSGCWVAIGKSGRPPGSISSASGAPWSTRSRRTLTTLSAIGISPPPKRPSSTAPRSAGISCMGRMLDPGSGDRLRPKRPAIHLTAASAAGHSGQCASDPQTGAAANLGAKGAMRQRSRKPRTG